MIKVKALRKFTYGNFDKIINLERHNKDLKKEGTLYAGDTFECTKEVAKYLTGECGYVLVKIIEVIPEEETVDENVKEEKAKKASKKKRKK